MRANLCRTVVLAAVAVALVIATGATSLAENVPDQVYTVGYYSNADVGFGAVSGAPNAQLRLTNDGSTEGVLWADIYVFNFAEQMEECCSCGITPNGYLDVDVNVGLLGNPLTPEDATANGIIKVISSSSFDPTVPVPVGGIRGWLTHIQSGATSGTFSITETDLKDSYLSASEQSALGSTCSAVLSLGSGAGSCFCFDPKKKK
jgi:hypothetical protein